MPVLAFWKLHQNIDRLRAESEYRVAIVLSRAMAGGEGLTELLQELRDNIGVVAEIEQSTQQDETYDREGLMELKSLSAMM